MNFDPLLIIFALTSVLISMTIHEAMHAFASNALGDDTARHEGRLTLNPLAHIDPVTTVALPVFLAIAQLPIFGAAKPVPFNPERLRWGDFGAATVALAGPFTNLVLAVLAGAVFQLGLVQNEVLGQFLFTFMAVNVGFFLFNIIPFPPLDGSRFLYAVAPEPVRALMRSIESLGFMAIIIFIFLFYTVLARPFGNVMATVITALSGVQVTF
ncbi:site-2 protease family protein [Candidatus Saccharibacteria bacterium]|nr:site-2 protease family protein [Candidatus Saccharibacteria bacterium]